MTQSGIVVKTVAENSEAERAGIQKGDQIIECDGLRITDDVNYFLSQITKTEGKKQVNLKILRNNEPIELNVKGGKVGIEISKNHDYFSKMKQRGSSMNKKYENISSNTNYNFKTLLGFGQFISVVGWILMAIGAIIGLIGFISILSPFNAFGSFVSGLIILVIGLGLVTYGQLITCFVTIERNTNKTNQLLNSIKITNKNLDLQNETTE